MLDRIRQYQLYVLIPAGVVPALLNWPWTKALGCLCLLLWGLAWIQENPFLIQIRVIIEFFASSACFWAVANVLFPQIPLFLFLPIWVYISVYGLLGAIQWFAGKETLNEPSGCFPTVQVEGGRLKTEGETLSEDAIRFPTKNLAALFLLVFIGGAIPLHGLLNLYLEKPFQWMWWSSVTWGSLSILLFYPQTLDRSYNEYERRIVKSLSPLVIVLLITGHAIHYRIIEKRLDQSESPGEIAQQAFRAGYLNLGAQAAVKETIRRSKQSWIEALRYLRGQWGYVDKHKFAALFMNDPDARDNYFLLLICFGGRLALEPDEKAVDLIVSAPLQQLYLLTSKGRVLRFKAMASR